MKRAIGPCLRGRYDPFAEHTSAKKKAAQSGKTGRRSSWRVTLGRKTRWRVWSVLLGKGQLEPLGTQGGTPCRCVMVHRPKKGHNPSK